MRGRLEDGLEQKAPEVSSVHLACQHPCPGSASWSHSLEPRLVALQNATELDYLIHSDKRLSASCLSCVVRTGCSNCLQCASAWPWTWSRWGGGQRHRDLLLPTGMTHGLYRLQVSRVSPLSHDWPQCIQGRLPWGCLSCTGPHPPERQGC